MTQRIHEHCPPAMRKYSSSSCSSPPNAARRLYRNLSGKFRMANSDESDNKEQLRKANEVRHITRRSHCHKANGAQMCLCIAHFLSQISLTHTLTLYCQVQFLESHRNVYNHSVLELH